MTVAQLLRHARARLREVQAANAAEDATEDAIEIALQVETLLARLLKQTPAALIAGADCPVSAAHAAEFNALLARRARGEPLAYLTGQSEFWSLPITVTPAALIPRADSELLVEIALSHARKGAVNTIIELGTGSGAIALALARELPECAITATDISRAALALAECNYRDVTREFADEVKFARIEFQHGDWFDAVGARAFDLIIANPPYVAPDDPHLRGELRFEPAAALVAGQNGLAALTRIIKNARARLTARGMLLLEHGCTQGAAVRDLFARNNFSAITTARDLAGRERCTYARG